MKKENWKIGTNKHVVVTNSYEGFEKSSGHTGENARDYYGGNLICESIWREKDAHLISAAPDMLKALQNLENDDNKIPKKDWDLIQSAIKKAKGLSERQEDPHAKFSVSKKSVNRDGRSIELRIDTPTKMLDEKFDLELMDLVAKHIED